MKYKWDVATVVATVFGRDDYGIYVCTQSRSLRSTNELCKTIMAEMTPQEWAAAQRTYASFFEEGSISEVVQVEDPRRRLFNFIDSSFTGP